MLIFDNLNCKVSSLADNVRGELVYDLNFNINPLEIFCVEFAYDMLEKEKFCSNVYKYSK